MNHGSASAMKILNVFEPKAFETDMLPSPCFATIRLANRFGNDVPAAVNVRPTAIEALYYSIDQTGNWTAQDCIGRE